MPTAYAPDSYTSIAAQTDFTITFPYLRASHLTVTDDGASVSASNYSLVTGGTVLRFTTAPGTSSAIVISRVTPVGADYRLIDYVAGAGVSETELDEADQQLHYALEELSYNTSAAGLAAALATASAAAASAQTAQTAAELAETHAETAETNAELAEVNAELAEVNAELAETNAEAALATILTAAGKMPSLTRTSSTVITVSAGASINSTGAYVLLLTGAETITLTVSGVGGLGVARPSGAAAWFHAFMIRKDSDASIDVYADTSVTAANKPAGYTYYRRIGSFLINADVPGITVEFVQYGELFEWLVPVADIEAANPGTAAVSRALTVPPDVSVIAIVNLQIRAAIDTYIYLSALDTTDTAPSNVVSTAWIDGTISPDLVSGLLQIRTDTSRSIRSRLDASGGGTTLRLNTVGWIDKRGTV